MDALPNCGTRMSIPLQDSTYSNTRSLLESSSAWRSLFLTMLDQWNNKRESLDVALL